MRVGNNRVYPEGTRRFGVGCTENSIDFKSTTRFFDANTETRVSPQLTPKQQAVLNARGKKKELSAKRTIFGILFGFRIRSVEKFDAVGRKSTVISTHYFANKLF